MKEETKQVLQRYLDKYAFIGEMQNDILEAFNLLVDCYKSGGKLLICGNGGSAADADHIVGELLKGFEKYRPLEVEQKKLYEQFGEEGKMLANRLQGSLPAINLCAHTSLISAVINDIGGEEIFAQQVVGYGKKGDVMIGISTSGNSKNVINAGMVAKVQDVKTIGLTGNKHGKMDDIFDIVLKVPCTVTCDIQDMHSVVYHTLCAMVESEFWIR